MAFHTCNVNVRPISRGMLVRVQEARFLEFVHRSLGDFRVEDVARCEVVAAFDDFVAANLDERNGFGVAGLEPDACSCGNVEPEAVGSDAVKLQLGVRFYEVVMGPDLFAWLG